MAKIYNYFESCIVLSRLFLQKPCDFLKLSPKANEFEAFIAIIMLGDLKRQGVDEAGAGGIVGVEPDVATKAVG